METFSPSRLIVTTSLQKDAGEIVSCLEVILVKLWLQIVVSRRCFEGPPYLSRIYSLVN